MNFRPFYSLIRKAMPGLLVTALVVNAPAYGGTLRSFNSGYASKSTDTSPSDDDFRELNSTRKWCGIVTFSALALLALLRLARAYRREERDYGLRAGKRIPK